jgi:hypothetical protein
MLYISHHSEIAFQLDDIGTLFQVSSFEFRTRYLRNTMYGTAVTLTCWRFHGSDIQVANMYSLYIAFKSGTLFTEWTATTRIGTCHVDLFFFVVKGPAAEVTDAPQP